MTKVIAKIEECDYIKIIVTYFIGQNEPVSLNVEMDGKSNNNLVNKYKLRELLLVDNLNNIVRGKKTSKIIDQVNRIIYK